jgi:hypothetical protein
MKKALLFLFAGAFMLLNSCTEKNYYTVSNVESEGTIVTSNPTGILTFSELKNISKGTEMYIRINRTGFQVESHAIKYEGTLEEMGENLIVCKTLNNLSIGQGDSGSPIVTKDGKIVGALCYGFSGSNTQFIARAIEDIMSIESGKKSVKQNTNSIYERIEPYVYFTSNSINLPSYANTDFAIKCEPSKSNSLKSGKSDDQEPAHLIAGMSIDVSMVKGDIVNYGAVGTISYIEGNNLYAFGHSFMGQQTNGMPAFHREMITLIESHGDEPSYKLSAPSDFYIGALVKDQTEGILINKDSIAYYINTLHTINVNNGEKLKTFKHTISLEFYPYDEIYMISLSNALAIDVLVSNSTYQNISGQSIVNIILSDNTTINRVFTTENSYYYDSDFFYWLRNELYYIYYYYDLRIKDIKINSHLTTI